jgi:hypothetical protein
MPFEIKLLDDHKIIEISYAGDVTSPELLEAFKAVILFSQKTGVGLFLADCTMMEGGHSLFDLFELIKQYDNTDFRDMGKEAVLLPNDEKAAENAVFYENACFNRGYNVKIFTDRETAVKWLLNKHSPKLNFTAS